MSDSTNKTVMAGVSIVLAVVFGIVGVGVLDSAQLDEEFRLDTETEWNNYAQALNGVNVTADGVVQLSAANVSGSYDSITLDANESDSNRYHVYASVPEPENSTVSLVVGGTTYDLQDGINKVDVTAADSFQLDFQRDATSVESPSVDTVSALSGANEGGLLRLVGVAAFGLLILLVAVQYMGIGTRRTRR